MPIAMTAPSSGDGVIPPLEVPRIEVVVVQPTPFCNIDCAYCYLPDRGNTSKIALETVAVLFGRVFDSGWAAPELTVIWHAGEPLVMPVVFYRQAFETIAKLCPPGIELSHSIQTNGMLITDAYCELFRDWQVKLGVSLDGPQPVHDAKRRTRSGHGTFDRTMAGIRCLQANAVPFHVISVLGEASIDRPDDMHDFYVDAGIAHVCFNVEESEGSHASALFAAADLDGRFRSFLRRFWKRARAEGKIEFIREVDGMIRLVFRPDELAIHNHQVEPLGMLNVDWSGRVSTFSPELLGLRNADYNDYIIGNILTDSLAELRANAWLAKMTAEISAGVAACARDCGYFSVCGGGAPVNKLTENGSFASTRTKYCSLTQIAAADLILESLDQLA
jgi:uncharacterized protein